MIQDIFTSNINVADNYLFPCGHFSSAQVLGETSQDVNCDQSTVYAKPIGTPPGSSLNISAPTFVPRHGSAFSITSLPPAVTTSGGWGPFDS